MRALSQTTGQHRSGRLTPQPPGVSAHGGKPHFVGGFPDRKIPARTRLSPPVSINL